MSFGKRVRSAVVRSGLLAAASALATSPAFAGETITYSYDALGRLVKVSHSGTVNGGASACYTYDHASNRSNVLVNTASDCSNGPPPSFSINNPSASEGDTVTFTVTRSGSSGGTYTLNYATADKEAVAGSDYTAKSGTLTFTDGIMSQTIPVATIEDSVIEPNEGFYVNLSNPSGGAILSDNQGLGTITNDDVPPPCQGVQFAAGDASATEGGNLTFTITKTGTATGSCSVNYATSDGTAGAGSDYTAKSGTLTFTTAQTSQTVVVATVEDTTYEPSETVHLYLTSPTGGATFADDHGVGTITDDDPACGTVSFTIASNGAVTEGGSSVFTVTKSGSAPVSCTVNYATGNATAFAGSDYTAKSGTLTFTSAQTSQTVSVATIDDSTTENAETFHMALSAPSNGGSLGSAWDVSATIDDNDIPPCTGVSFAVSSNGAVTEGASSIFTFTKTGTTSSSCSVNYGTADISALGGSDYTATNGVLTFTSTQTSMTVSVPTIDDSTIESPETFKMTISSAGGGSTISTPVANATLNDNDTPVNHPPVAVNDTGSQTTCSVEVYTVTSNDTDPDGDYPLSLVSVTGAGSMVSSTNIQVASGRATGTKIATYSVQDSKGATATATLTVTVVGGGNCTQLVAPLEQPPETDAPPESSPEATPQ
ncbi:MAG TPA: Calx-beta domain-containing protein [Sphingomicrobium sp.]|nr:Calx-beta domain-containing protein [Sphingomicrobium sp.]